MNIIESTTNGHRVHMANIVCQATRTKLLAGLTDCDSQTTRTHLQTTETIFNRRYIFYGELHIPATNSVQIVK